MFRWINKMKQKGSNEKRDAHRNGERENNAILNERLNMQMKFLNRQKTLNELLTSAPWHTNL